MPDNERLCALAQAGDAAARDLLLERNMGFVRKLALELKYEFDCRDTPPEECRLALERPELYTLTAFGDRGPGLPSNFPANKEELLNQTIFCRIKLFHLGIMTDKLIVVPLLARQCEQIDSK